MFANKQKKLLPYGQQFLAGAEYRAVRRVLKSAYLTQGPTVERFEQALKNITGAPYAVAVANGTIALDLAVRAVKIQRGLQDGALAATTANTFVASSNALLYNQLEPIFCDISLDTYNLSLSELDRLLAIHNRPSDQQKAATNHNTPEHNKKVEAPPHSGLKPIELLLPVHFAGEPVDMARLWELAHNYATADSGISDPDQADAGVIGIDSVEPAKSSQPRRLAIVEDAAHALGSYYRENSRSGKVSAQSAVGSCVYSDACCFSFHPVKAVTTAEGGAITCRDPELYEILLLLRNHGINRNPDLWLHTEENCESGDLAEMEQGVVPLWYYEMQALGQNARLSDVHAAIGVEQLRRLPDFAQRRRVLALRYSEAFKHLSWLRTPQISRVTCPHLYVVQMNFAYLRLSRNQVMCELQAKNIGSQVHYIPVAMQPFYRHLGYHMNDLENTREYYRAALSLPLYPGLRPKDQEQVIRAVCHLAEL